MTNDTIVVAGIDTAKDKLDVAVHGSAIRFTVANRPVGWRRLAGALAKAGVDRVGIEATGGYERGVVDHLRGAGIAVLVLQPLQVKAYARLHLRRAKNDQLDAVLIAACAAVVDAAPIAPDPRLSGLRDALTLIEQIEEDIARWKTRLEHTVAPRLRRWVLAEIARLQRRRAAELRHLAAALHRHDDLARRFALVLSVEGIGERTALALVLRLPELGRMRREQAAALAGMAPFDDDTGQHKGAAFRWNPALIALYRRLKARGKPHRLMLVACARKLLIYANAVLARGTPWIKRPATA